MPAPLQSIYHTLPAWAAGYIGLPYKKLGRKPDGDGWDCWGGAAKVALERGGLRIPLYDAVGWTDKHNRHGVAAAMAQFSDRDWRRLPDGEERPFDFALLQNYCLPIHVGCIVAPGWMLHLEEGTNMACEPYDQGRWAKRYLGVYRYVGTDPA